MTTTAAKTVTTTKGLVSYGETGDGPTLMILHSLLTDRRAFDPVITALPGRKVTLDLPGFGLSDHAAPIIEDFADAMAAATETICDGRTSVVMGNGLGAFISLEMAIRRPELISRLVLVGCGAAFPEEARPAFQKMIDLVSSEGMEAVIPVALRRIFTEDYLATHPDEARERARVLADTDPTAFINACTALYGLDFGGTVAGITAPTLIVVGEDDQATPPAMAEHLHGLLPNSELSVLPGLAHAPQLQDPQGFVDAIRPFLEGR